MSNYLQIHHSSLIIKDTQASLTFYRDILGMKVAERADLPFQGVWLEVGSQQIHLLELANPDPVTGRPEHGGRDRHTAILVRDLARIIAVLEENNIPYTQSRSGRAALFFRDPDGNALEMIEVVSLA